jgi:hypothetical protein
MEVLSTLLIIEICLYIPSLKILIVMLCFYLFTKLCMPLTNLGIEPPILI